MDFWFRVGFSGKDQKNDVERRPIADANGVK